MFARLVSVALLLTTSALASAAQSEAPADPLERAWALLAGGEAAEAEAVFEERLQAAPDDPAAVEGRVRSLLTLDRWREALDVAREGRERLPEDPRVTAALSEALFRAGRLTELDALATRAAVDPGVAPRTLAQLGRLRAAQGRTAESGELLERALAADPSDRDVLYWAGDLASGRQRTIELLERYLESSEGDLPRRIESVEGSLRMLRELGDRRVWISESSPESLSLKLTHVWQPSGSTVGYVVDAAAGPKGKRVRLLLDTGSHGLYLVDRLAAKRGFTHLADKTQFGAGGDGRHESSRGLIPEFALGELRYRDALASTTADELDATGRFHGLLGVSIFGGYRVALDLKKKRLELSLDAAPLDGAPYWWVSGQMLVEARVGGESGLFLVDTGAMGTIVASAVAERLGSSSGEEAPAVRTLAGSVEGVREVRGLTVEVAGLSSGGAPLMAWDFSTQNRLGGIEVAGLLGLDLLAGRRIEIDTVRQTIRVVPRTGD